MCIENDVYTVGPTRGTEGACEGRDHLDTRQGDVGIVAIVSV